MCPSDATVKKFKNSVAWFSCDPGMIRQKTTTRRMFPWGNILEHFRYIDIIFSIVGITIKINKVLRDTLSHSCCN